MSPICTAAAWREAEQQAFHTGQADPAALMEKAGAALARAVRQFFPTPGRLLVFCGKGNNAGDALLAARLLHGAGWSVAVEWAFPEDQLHPLALHQWHLLRSALHEKPPVEPAPGAPKVILDGLLGHGARNAPEEPVAGCIRQINALRSESSWRVVAVDIPSGLNLENGQPHKDCVQADYTVTFGAIKHACLEDAATDFVGRIALYPLSEIEAPTVPNIEAATPLSLRSWLPPRNYDSHKGRFGRLLIIAGSMGFYGAAKLCAMGALHAGAGLVTLACRPQDYPYILIGLPPEAMLQTYESFEDLLGGTWDAAVIGPGLTASAVPELPNLLRNFPFPTVVDAGGLDPLISNHKLLRLVLAPRVLTPHPGEMARLTRNSSLPRADLVRSFIEENPCVLLLKGARTLIGAPGRPLFYNTTGGPALSTGGTGDVLAGVIGALLGQGLRPSQAAVLGAWLCGRAADIALSSGTESEESFTASQVAAYLGRAFQSLRNDEF